MTFYTLSPPTVVLRVVILLSLIVSFGTPTLSLLDTGYDYQANENPTMEDQHRDLKCTYLIAGMTHMRLLKFILEQRQISTGLVVHYLIQFEIRGVICTLYREKLVAIGSLWLLLLYVNTVQSHHEFYIVRSANPDEWQAAVAGRELIHDYVTERLQNELTAANCRPNNRYDTYESWRESHARPLGKPRLKDVMKEASGNCDRLKALLNKNQARKTYGRRFNALRSRLMFLHNLGTNQELKSTLMEKYDVQVTWSGTLDVLKDDYHRAQKMYSPADGFLSVQKYYSNVFNFFKCILFRMTWKFSLSVHASTGSHRRDNFKKWQNLLVEFQKLLCLQDDQDVNGLLVVIRNHGSVEISNQLDAKLRSFNESLQCVATDQMFLDPERLPSSSDPGTSSSQPAVDRDSLKDAKAFIADLKWYFQEVDFDAIRSLLKYIEDEE